MWIGNGAGHAKWGVPGNISHLFDVMSRCGPVCWPTVADNRLFIFPIVPNRCPWHLGEWRGGISPPRARRTRREPLDASRGPHNTPAC